MSEGRGSLKPEDEVWLGPLSAQLIRTRGFGTHKVSVHQQESVQAHNRGVDHFGHLFTTAGDFSMGTGCRLMVASCFSWEQPNQYRCYYTGWTLLRLSKCDRERAPSCRDCSSKHDVRHKSPAIPEFLPPCAWYSTCHQPARLRLTTCSDRSPSSRGQERKYTSTEEA